jgi:hypothetical protein
LAKKTEDRVLEVQYLLGALSEESRITFEDRYFGDSELFEGLVAAENDLIDSYVRGDLSESERKQFESCYLTSHERLERVEFAKSLRGYTFQAGMEASTRGRREPSTGRWSVLAFLKAQTPAMQLALTIVFLGVVAGSSWIAVLNLRLRHELGQVRIQQTELQQQDQQLRQQIAKLEAQSYQSEVGRKQQEIAQLQPSGSSIVSMILTAGLSRSSGEQQTLLIPPGTSSVRLQLSLERDDYPSYDVVLETADGVWIRQESGLKSHSSHRESRKVTVQASPSVFKSGDYVLILNGVAVGERAAQIEAYTFRAVRP